MSDGKHLEKLTSWRTNQGESNKFFLLVDSLNCCLDQYLKPVPGPKTMQMKVSFMPVRYLQLCINTAI